MIRYSHETLSTYMARLACREPVPGGGSASAIAGALGSSLIAMSTRYSLGKGKAARIEKRFQAIIKKADAATRKFLTLSSQDAQAYLNAVKARKRGTAAYQKALKKAAAVPGEILALSRALQKDLPFLMKEGNKYLLSDVCAAQSFLKAAEEAARIMIETNQ